MSWTIRPVTQVAEVAVNTASINGVASPVFDAKGRVRRTAPVIIIRKKPPRIILAGVSDHTCFPIILLY